MHRHPLLFAVATFLCALALVVLTGVGRSDRSGEAGDVPPVAVEAGTP